MRSVDQSSVKSAPQSVSSFAVNQSIEAKLNLKDLEKIMTAFMPGPDYKGEQIQLNCDEFSERLRSVLKKGCKNDYIELFEKIDITKEGTVDWDKFVEYMLLEFYEEDEKVKTTQVPQWKELRMISSPHKEPIQRVELLKCMNRYVTVSKEGMVVFWDLQMKLAKNSRLSVEAIKQKDLWVTDCVVMANINKLAVTFTSKEIVIYDLSSKPDFNCQYRIQGFKYTPICLNYWFNSDDMEHSILSVGDMGGEVTAIIFYSAQTTLFPRPHHQGGKEGQHADEITTCIKLKNIPREKTKHGKLRLVHHDIHDGWVRYVKYIEHLECFISCSTGKKHSIILSYIDKVKSPMRSVVLHYENGVNCFDYHKRLNLIVTGGINNQVCLWNPYVISKPVGVLSGHMAPVTQVTVNQRKTQAMTFSKDKVLRVWDIQQQLCLQRIAGIFPKGPEGVQSRMYFDDNVNRLFVTFNYQLTALDMKVEIREQVLSHDQPVSCVIYNPKHNQVLTGCVGGVVNVWMIDNGQKIKQFQDCHGQAEIATMALDQDGSRLLTGGSDGSVKIWDFNGHCHHNLTCAGGQSADISQIVMLKHSIAVIGWSRILTIFRKSSLKEYHVESSDWIGGSEHQDDILCADYHLPSLLVTGSYDGEIVVWNANSEMVVRKLAQRSRSFLLRETSSSQVARSRESQQRPITAESQTSELEFSCVISRLILLKHRLQATTHEGCDLISCGGTGWCRFWSITNSDLMHEFIAHPHAGNIIGSTDDENNYLVTGDSDGLIKIWSISNYLLNYDDVKVDPERLTSWQAHQDVISSILICKKMGNLLIITASSDCSVTLWDFHGGKIGDFGQEKHWRLDLALESLRNKENDNTGTQNENEEKDFMDEFESRCTTAASQEDTRSDLDDLDRRYNTWSKTVLGERYREERSKKRERKQPGTVPGFKRYLESVQTPYGVLNCSELKQTLQVEKPDFVINPHKYFGEKLMEPADESSNVEGEKPADGEQSIRETRHLLKAAFDEKTFFPKELLEYETQMRAQHQQKLRLINSKKPKLSTPGGGILKSSNTSQMFHQQPSISIVSSSTSNQQQQQTSKTNKIPATITFLPTTAN